MRAIKTFKILRTVLIILTLYLMFPFGLMAQYGPLYWNLRDYDSISGYRQAMNAFNQKNYDNAFSMLDSLAEQYNSSGLKRRFYQLRNEKGAMQFVIRQFDKSYEILSANIDNMIADEDTLHYEFAIALRLMSYLTKVSDKPKLSKLDYQKRQYNLLKAMNDNSPLLMDCLSDIGMTCIYAGETEKSLDYFQESRKLAYSQKGMEHSLLITEHTMANMLEIEQPYLALQIFESQFATAPRSYYRDSAALVVLAYTLAEKYLRTGKPDKALQFFLKADSLQVLTGFPNTSLIPAIPLEIAIGYSRTGDSGKFIKYATRAEKDFERITVRPPFPREDLYRKIAEGYGNLNNDSALIFLSKAIEVIRIKENADADNLALLYLNISKFYQSRNCIDNAIKAADTAIAYLAAAAHDTSRSGIAISRHYSTAIEIYYHANLVYLEKHTEDGNKKFLDNALRAALKYDSLMFRIGFASSDPAVLLEYSLNYKNLASRTLEAIYNKPGNEEIAFRFICNSKAFQLQNDRKRMDYARSVAANDSLWKAKTAFDKQLAHFNNLKTTALINNENAKVDSIENILKKVLIETLVINYKIISRQNSSSSNHINNPNLTSLIENINKDQVVIDVFQTSENIFVSALNYKGIKINKINGKKEFGNHVKNLLRSIKTGEDFQLHARNISNHLLSPFIEQLKNTKHVVFIPDNNLQLIPLEVLPNPVTNETLINSHSVSYHYSISLWLDGTNKKKPDQYSLLAMAPVYTSDTTSEDFTAVRGIKDIHNLREIMKNDALAQLPYSLSEINAIKSLAELYGIQCSAFAHSEASKANLKKFSGDFNILHLSAHGYVSKEEPQFSGIFLASEKKNQIEKHNPTWELLHLGELALLETPANLAVLSACNSASGAIHEGEGIMSLSRGCLIAGIPNVIAALWQVNDKSTSELMISFYTYLFKGNNYSVALQLAKKDCIAKGMLPLDWSSFILTGN